MLDSYGLIVYMCRNINKLLCVRGDLSYCTEWDKTYWTDSIPQYL